MTEQEKKEIISEVELSIMEKMKGKCIKEDTQAALAEPRNKWFSNSVGNRKDSPMFEQFGTYAYWRVWDNIRKLTCLICGVGYVRQLNSDMRADEIADKICQFVYELRCEKTNKVNDDRKENQNIEG